MKRVLTGQRMRDIDRATIEDIKMPVEVLIERAALQVFSFIEKNYKRDSKIAIVAGSGSNGADGFALYRIMKLLRYDVSLYQIANDNELSPNTQRQKRILSNYGLSVSMDFHGFDEYDIIVDAILGTGLNRDVSGVCADWLIAMEKASADVISIDIPSGISSEDGKVMGTSVHAKHTITFAYAKCGELLYPGREYVGNLVVCDVGIYEDSKRYGYFRLEKSDCKVLPDRIDDSYKGTYGKVLCIASNKGMSGAAFFAGMAAYRIGAGLIKVYAPEANRTIIQSTLPEAIISTYESFDEDGLIEEIKWADSIILGPGLGEDRVAEKIVDCVLKNSSVPVVVDASALSIIAKNTDRLKLPHSELILTPHFGEMAKLMGVSIPYIHENALRTVEEFSRNYNVTCVLKGSTTIISIPYGDTFFSTLGNNGMATGGSGDVLAGIIGGALGFTRDIKDAVISSVVIHSEAGRIASEKKGQYSMTARDILDGISEVTKQLN
ncbi:MAG: NAD(P)H-hydrate dehydratase [Lachnospiraceae bacterium]|nr:NAD(P)H-hydrate dehydratase [Lachnospiraceae bacterium]